MIGDCCNYHRIPRIPITDPKPRSYRDDAIVVRKPQYFSAFIGVSLAFILLAGCSQSSKFSQPASATGVCYSNISVVGPDNAIVSFHQLLLVKSSGDPAADIRRIRTYSEDRYLSRNPDTVPNKWWSAWLTDDRFDATRGPDCSGLPMIVTK